MFDIHVMVQRQLVKISERSRPGLEEEWGERPGVTGTI